MSRISLRNTGERYGAVAVALHWLIAAGFIFMLGLGVYMADLPLSDPDKFSLYQWHKSIGITILLLAAVRLIWRTVNVVPPLPPGLKPYERFLARLTHGSLYAALFAMPLAGWVMVSASPYGIPTMLYGVVEWPHIGWIESSPQKGAIEDWAHTAHWVIAILAGLALLLHIGAALKHHFVLKDNVLRRMLPMRLKQTKGSVE